MRQQYHDLHQYPQQFQSDLKKCIKKLAINFRFQIEVKSRETKVGQVLQGVNKNEQIWAIKRLY